MNQDAVQHQGSGPQWLFLPLFFSVAGGALLHKFFFLVGANYRAHLVAAVLGLIFSLWSALPSIRGEHPTAGTDKRPLKELRWAAGSGALLLLALGAALGALVTTGSVFLLAIGAASLNFVPWARLSISRYRPALSFAVSSAGFASTFFTGVGASDVMFLPLASWAFWGSACIGLLLRAEQSRRSGRDAKAKNTAAAQESHPAVCNS